MTSRADSGAPHPFRPLPFDTHHSPFTIHQNLVRLGQLDFDDLLLLQPDDVRRVIAAVNASPDLCLAFNNAPHIINHFRRSLPTFLSPSPDSSLGIGNSSLSAIHAAQSHLLSLFSPELLIAKAPPLYDSLPWHDWDFSIVTKRFKLWQTRFLLAGAGTSVTMCRCHKSAGVYVWEPNPTLARYIERKAALEKVRRFRLLPSAPSASTSSNLQSAICNLKSEIVPSSLPAVDLSILASPSPSSLMTHDPSRMTNLSNLQSAIYNLKSSVLLVENSPLFPPLDPAPLLASGFTSSTVEVRSVGLRPCWWRLAR
jgi:hypothetical protein